MDGPKTRLRKAFYFFFLPLLLISAAETAFPGERTLVTLTVGGKKIKAEVVRTEEEKSQGLMFRESLGRDEGMLFVYEREEILSFWMKNTRIPLAIAFLDRHGRIVDIQEMEPFSLNPHPSRLPAQYALEMNRGWFQKNRIKPGEPVKIPAAAR